VTGGDRSTRWCWLRGLGEGRSYGEEGSGDESAIGEAGGATVGVGRSGSTA
jgi:hypothetical protein